MDNTNSQTKRQVKTLYVYVSAIKDNSNKQKNMFDSLGKLLGDEYNIGRKFHTSNNVDIVLVEPRFVGISEDVIAISKNNPDALCILFDIDNSELVQFNENYLKDYFKNNKIIKFSDIQNDPSKLLSPKQQYGEWNLLTAAKVAQDLEKMFEQGYYPENFTKYLDVKHYIFVNGLFSILLVVIFLCVTISIAMQCKESNNLVTIIPDVIVFIVIFLILIFKIPIEKHSKEQTIYGPFVTRPRDNTIISLSEQKYSNNHINLTCYKMQVHLDQDVNVEIYLLNERHERRLFYKGQIINNKFYKGDFYDVVKVGENNILYTI